jgi:hypothetical protein
VRCLRPSGIWKKDTLEEKSSSPCEANPKEDSCSHSGGEDVTGEHLPQAAADSLPEGAKGMRDGMTSVGKAVGCQFVGKPYGEADLVRLANAYESEA